MTKDIETIKLRGNDPTKTIRSIWDGEFVDILSKYRSLDEGGAERDKSNKSDFQEVKTTESGTPIKSAQPDIPPSTDDMPKSVLSAMEALRRLKSSQAGEQSSPVADENYENGIKAQTTTVEEQPSVEIENTSNADSETQKSYAHEGAREANQESIEKVKQRYMVGKIVGEDIFDSRGVVIVKRHELITMDIIDRVEKAGKIVDLVVNMQFPD